ncbi:helix-turn-helix domain-containing protein [Micromonospora sp. KC213]|uniref:helix-turn-helix domain-containing protein n=1 Tax=Micromonospora sp. KC213 TaxID=2530378 RepID=UPI001FB65858|nr:helix-turn-helix domain-containing protein [Micromonospora sp. KC213]
MSNDMYSVEQVAERLGLHVRTVRGYIRSGRLKATRIGKQYRIARADLDALLGRAAPAARDAAPALEVASIVTVDGIDRSAADRLSTLVLASLNNPRPAARPLRAQTVHDEQRMKIVLMGDASATAEVLHLLDAVLADGTGLLTGEDENA